MVTNNKIIKNNIRIGTNNKLNNLVITGPNACGKSTFIKSMGISILLSQTFTVTPCNQMKITPLSIINTYLNIPDDKCKESLFQAELNRTISHIQKIRGLSETKFGLIIMDEIFSSTNPEAAITGAYTLMNILGKFRNSITIFTTHFKQLTELEDKSRFINYNFPIRRVNGKIEFIYKLRKGVSKDSIATELIKNILNKLKL